MTKFFKSLLLTGVLGIAGLSMTGCGATVVAVDPGMSQIVNQVELQKVLTGFYGVDALGRPLNAYGYPVDLNGYPLTGSPVIEVYNQPVSLYYSAYLYSHYRYRYEYRPSYVNVYRGVGVTHYTSRPTSTVVRTTIPRGSSTVVRPGANRTVAPSGPRAITPPRTTVTPGTRTVTPSPRTGPSRVAPSAPRTITPPRTVSPPRTGVGFRPATSPRPSSGFRPSGGSRGRR